MQVAGQPHPSPADMDLWRAFVFCQEDEHNALERAREALTDGADTAMADPFDRWSSLTTLSAAVIYGNVDMVELLLDAGAKPIDIEAECKLFRFSTTVVGKNWTKQADSLRCLFSRGMLESVTVSDILVAMHDMAEIDTTSSCVELMRVCVQHAIAMGADMSALLAHRQSNGYTLLHTAVMRLWEPPVFALVSFLLECGANVLLRDDRNYTPEDLANLPRFPDPDADAIGEQVITILKEERLQIAKAAAFAMGHHERLGIGSMLDGLDPEVTRLILERMLGRVAIEPSE
jgi:hypothetical protein